MSSDRIRTPKQFLDKARLTISSPEELLNCGVAFLENTAENIAKATGTGKADNVYAQLKPLAAECPELSAALSDYDLRVIAAKAVRENIARQERDLPYETWTKRNGASDITAELKAMEQAAAYTSQQFHFGIDLLDDAIGGGIRRGEMLSIIGNPGSMKTSLLLNGIETWIAERPQDKTGLAVVFYSLDMSRTDIWHRLLLREIYCDMDALMEKIKLKTPDYLAACKKLSERLQGKIKVSDNAEAEKWTVEKIIEHTQNNMPEVVCIDYLTQLRSDKMRNDYEIANNAAVKLKDMAHTYNCAVVILSQMSQASRNIQAAGGFGGSAKGGAAVEENCTAEIELFKDHPEHEGGAPRYIATVKKSRNVKGQDKVWHSYELEHKGAQMRFSGFAYEVQRVNNKVNKNIFTGQYC